MPGNANWSWVPAPLAALILAPAVAVGVLVALGWWADRWVLVVAPGPLVGAALVYAVGRRCLDTRFEAFMFAALGALVSLPVVVCVAFLGFSP